MTIDSLIVTQDNSLPASSIDPDYVLKAAPSTALQTVEGIKKETVAAVEGFLKNTKDSQSPSIKPIDLNIDGSVDSYSNLMKQLNRTLDARCNIIHHEIDGPAPLGQKVGAKSTITLRDTRNTNGAVPEGLAESWMEAMAAQARGVSSLLDVNTAPKSAKVLSDNDVKKAIAKTFVAYCDQVRGASSPTERKKIVTEFNQELVGALKSHGVIIGNQKLSDISDEKVIQIMGDARDFCNLGEQTQNHKVTISKDFDNNGSSIWASMKINPLSPEIQSEYEQVKTYKENKDSGIDRTPQWFQDLKPHQKELTMKYLDQITDGNHALPTQLRFLPGLKNAYIDVRGSAKDGKMSEETYVECHSGTLVHNAGTEDSIEARRVTELNMNHAKELVGQRQVVLSVLNTNTILQPGERNIYKISKEIAGKTKGVEYHQNGVNLTSLNPDKSLKNIEKFSVETNKSGQKEKILWTACKSGKDRTFALLMLTSAKIFGAKNPAEYTSMMSKTGHQETMASGAGATRGAYGLKLKEMFIRMTNPVLVKIKERLTNSISGVNVMQPTKLKHSIYAKMLDTQIKESPIASSNKKNEGPSPEALANRKVLTENSITHASPTPNVKPEKKRRMTI